MADIGMRLVSGTWYDDGRVLEAPPPSACHNATAGRVAVAAGEKRQVGEMLRTQKPALYSSQHPEVPNTARDTLQVRSCHNK